METAQLELLLGERASTGELAQALAELIKSSPELRCPFGGVA